MNTWIVETDYICLENLENELAYEQEFEDAENDDFEELEEIEELLAVSELF